MALLVIYLLSQIDGKLVSDVVFKKYLNTKVPNTTLHSENAIQIITTIMVNDTSTSCRFRRTAINYKI